MIAVERVEGRAYPLGRSNVDTDVIIAAEHLKTIARAGLGRHAFETIRREPGNVFDDPAYAGASILIAGDNFGCGSSREHAAWALGVARDHPIAVDLGTMTVTSPLQDRFQFEMDPFRRECLVEGLDEIALTLASEAAIRAYEIRTGM